MHASGFKKWLAMIICLAQLVSLFFVGSAVYAAGTAALPDLVVTKLITSPANPKSGDMVSFSAVITNKGAAISANSNFTVGWDFGDGIYYWSAPVTKALKTNEAMTVTCTGGSGPDGAQWKAKTGKSVLNSMVDNYAENDTGFRIVKESDEYNNALTMTVTVTEAPKAAPGPAKPKETQTAGAYYIKSDKNEAVDDGIEQLTAEVNRLRMQCRVS